MITKLLNAAQWVGIIAITLLWMGVALATALLPIFIIHYLVTH